MFTILFDDGDVAQSRPRDCARDAPPSADEVAAGTQVVFQQGGYMDNKEGRVMQKREPRWHHGVLERVEGSGPAALYHGRHTYVCPSPRLATPRHASHNTSHALALSAPRHVCAQRAFVSPSTVRTCAAPAPIRALAVSRLSPCARMRIYDGATGITRRTGSGAPTANTRRTSARNSRTCASPAACTTRTSQPWGGLATDRPLPCPRRRRPTARMQTFSFRTASAIRRVATVAVMASCTWARRGRTRLRSERRCAGWASACGPSQPCHGPQPSSGREGEGGDTALRLGAVRAH